MTETRGPQLVATMGTTIGTRGAGSADGVGPGGSDGVAVLARALSLGYGSREVLSSAGFEVRKGEFLALLGPSGSGKTTLLLAMNGSVPVRSGTLEVLGRNPSILQGRTLERFRERIGFIYQSFHLVGRMQVLHNVASGFLSRISIPRALLQWYRAEEYAGVLEALRVVGLEDRALDRCDRLSGGQRQRVAIARALVQGPSLLLADEPVSALDPRSAKGVLELLKRASRQYGITVVCTLHHLDAARSYADRVVGLNRGRIVFDGTPDQLTPEVVDAIYQGDEERADSPAETAALSAAETA